MHSDSNRALRAILITDSRSAEGMGDTWWRGCTGVRHRAFGKRPVLRQRRPELHSTRNRIRILYGTSRQPLLPGSH